MIRRDWFIFPMLAVLDLFSGSASVSGGWQVMIVGDDDSSVGLGVAMYTWVY